MVGRKIIEVSSEKSFSHLTSRSVKWKFTFAHLYLFLYFRNPVYQSAMEPLEEVPGNDQSDYVSFVENLYLKDHAYDSQSLKKSKGVCNFPQKKLVEQVRGSHGPRFYNKITPSQQLASFVNQSLNSML